MKEKIKMDVNKCLTDLMEQYEYEDIKELSQGWREAWQSGGLAILPEIPGLVPSTHTAAHNCL